MEMPARGRRPDFILFFIVLVLIAFPPFAAALFALIADRRFGAQIFEPENGGAMLWQH